MDNNKRWKQKTTELGISWTNLSDGMGQSAGFSSYFEFMGIPFYVLIDPNSIILNKWTGYEKGMITNKISPILDKKDKKQN